MTDKKINKPIRDRIRGITDSIPSGPKGKAGEGDLLGAGGYLAVETIRAGTQFIPGIQQPGYKIYSHSVESEGKHEIHSFEIAAISQDVAEFVAQYFSSPSNVNFLLADVEILNVEINTSRRTYDRFAVKTRISKSGLE